jgi:hypothetical protein
VSETREEEIEAMRASVKGAGSVMVTAVLDSE